MEGRAAGIDHQRRLVVEDKKLDLVLRARFGQAGKAVDRGKAVGDSFFHDALAVGDGNKAGFHRMPLDGERAVAADKGLPRQRLRTLEQRVEAVGAKSAEADEHPFGAAQVNVGARDGLGAALEKHAAVDGFQTAAAQRVDVLGDEFFQPEQACGDQFHGRIPFRTGKQGLKS